MRLNKFYFKYDPETYITTYDYVIDDTGLSKEIYDPCALQIATYLSILNFQLNAENTKRIAAKIPHITDESCAWKLGCITNIVCDKERLYLLAEHLKKIIITQKELKAIL